MTLWSDQIELEQIKQVNSAINGDLDSFGMLCSHYYPAMTAIAYCILHDRHLAEDAVQESYARALEKLPDLRKPAKFNGWLKSICRNTAINIARQQKRTASIEYAEQIPAAENNDNEMTNEIQKAISKLPEKARELVTMRYFANLSHEQVAEVAGLTPAAVNARLCRIRKTLEKTLNKTINQEKQKTIEMEGLS